MEKLENNLEWLRWKRGEGKRPIINQLDRPVPPPWNSPHPIPSFMKENPSSAYKHVLFVVVFAIILFGLVLAA